MTRLLITSWAQPEPLRTGAGRIRSVAGVSIRKPWASLDFFALC